MDFDRCSLFLFLMRAQPPALADYEEFNKYVPVFFGLPNKNITWRLGRFLPKDTIHKFALLPEQVDSMPNLVDWDMISTHNLSGLFLRKHKERINWSIFLKNKHPKNIDDLISVKDKINEHQHLFYDIYMKRRYYTLEFISKFAYMIDWKWVCKNIKLPEHALLLYWDKFNSVHISKYQTITDHIAKTKLHAINWIIASKKKLAESTISIARNYVDWEIICKKQQLSTKFISQFALYVHWANVSRYQELTDEFIIKYQKKLNMSLISTYQNMTVATIRELENVLRFDLLLKNSHYNKFGTPQITTNGKEYFVIEPPPLGKIAKVSYYSAESAEF